MEQTMKEWMEDTMNIQITEEEMLENDRKERRERYY